MTFSTRWCVPGLRPPRAAGRRPPRDPVCSRPETFTRSEGRNTPGGRAERGPRRRSVEGSGNDARVTSAPETERPESSEPSTSPEAPVIEPSPTVVGRNTNPSLATMCTAHPPAIPTWSPTKAPSPSAAPHSALPSGKPPRPSQPPPRHARPLRLPVAEIIWSPTIQPHRPRVGCAHDGYAHR